MKIICYLVLALLLASAVGALDITPTKKIYDFEPGQKIKGSFTVLNSEKKDMRLVLSTRGDASKYITLYDFIVDLKEDESSKEFQYEITMPTSFDKPGAHEAEIVVISQPANSDTNGAYVGTSIALATLIRIRVPYPGLYAETRLDVSEAGPNEAVKFILPVSNLGENNIQSAKGTIEILGPTSEVLGQETTEDKSIPSKTTTELSATWLAKVNPGVYHAKAAVSYDGKMTIAERNFAVGSLLIDIIGAEVKDFKLGGIAKITLTLQNKWNQEIKEVYAELFVYDDKGDQVYETKSSHVSLESLGTGTLPLFWDTQGLLSGSYTGKVILHYADKKIEKPINLAVGPDFMRASLTGRVTESDTAKEKSSEMSLMSIIIIGVVVLIAINIGLFIYLRRTVSGLKKQ